MKDDAISRQAVLKLLSTMPPEDAITKAMLIQSVKQMDAAQPSGPDNLVKDSQGLAKDLVNDCISRKAAIDALRTHERKASKKWFDNQLDIEWNNAIDICCYDIEDLPSAQPETHDKRTETHACDLIDRQMAIDGFYEMASDMDYLCTVSDYVSFLESLPSAQPEIIRCRDCKLRDTEYCNMAHGFMGMKDDDYCSYAERRWRRTND